MPINSWGVPITRAQIQQSPAVELTIGAGGAVTVTGSHHTIDTFGDAGSDNLDTVNGLVAGRFYRLRAEDDARTVILRHGIGNIICPDGVDVTLAEDQDEVLAFSPDGTNLLIDAENTLAGSPSATTGTTNLSWTVNIDTATAGEDALLVLSSANDAAAARDATLANRGQENAVELSGTAGIDFALIGTGGLQVLSASLDANPQAQLSASSLSFGSGGGSAVDWVMSRQAASIAELATGDSLFGLGAGILGIKTSTGDAVASIQIAGQVLSLGPGAAGALDWTLSRQTVSVAELGDADSLYILGVSQLGRRALSADANPTIAFTAAGLELGAGGASALDILISRIGAGALDFTTMTAFTAASNPTWNFGTGQADFGGNLDANAGADISGAALTIAGFDMAAGGQKIGGLGAATVAGDAVRFEQLDTQLNGSVAVADLLQSGQPIATETLLIGGDTYEFDGAGGNINVTIAGSAELTLDNLITAVNGSGTELLRADKIGATVLRLQSAATAGGVAANADPSIVLNASGVTNYAFETGDVNMNTLSGRASSLQNSARATLTATTVLIGGATAVFFQFAFTPVDFSIQVRNSAGVLKQEITDQFTIVTNAILWTSAGATHVVNTDTISIHAWA